MGAAHWDPQNELGIQGSIRSWIPDGIQCIGLNCGIGPTCGWTKGGKNPEGEDANEAWSLICALASRPPAEVTWNDLHRLATLCLCRENHWAQAPVRASEWVNIVQKISGVPVPGVPALYQHPQWQDAQQPQHAKSPAHAQLPAPKDKLAETQREQQRDPELAARQQALAQKYRDLQNEVVTLSTQTPQLEAQVSAQSLARKRAEADLADAEAALAALRIDSEDRLRRVRMQHAELVAAAEQQRRRQGQALEERERALEEKERALEEKERGLGDKERKLEALREEPLRAADRDEKEKQRGLRELLGRMREKERELEALRDSLRRTASREEKEQRGLRKQVSRLQQAGRELAGRVEEKETELQRTRHANAELRAVLRRVEDAAAATMTRTQPSWSRRVKAWFKRLGPQL